MCHCLRRRIQCIWEICFKAFSSGRQTEALKLKQYKRRGVKVFYYSEHTGSAVDIGKYPANVVYLSRGQMSQAVNILHAAVKVSGVYDGTA